MGGGPTGGGSATGGGGNCAATETNCSNGLDDDCDGLIDCADPDCLGQGCNVADSNVVCLSTAPAVCSCGVNDGTINGNDYGTVTVVELAGRPRVIYDGDNGNVSYTECTSGCSGSSPVWSAPITLGQNVGGNERPVVLTTAQGGLVVALRDQPGGTNGARLVYAECPTGNCDLATSWKTLQVTALGGERAGSYLDLDMESSLRAIAFERPDAGGAWAECSTNCAADAGNWTFYETGLASNSHPTALVRGGVRRAMFGIAGGAGNTGVNYVECNGNQCPTAGWVSVRASPSGRSPDLTLDSHGVLTAFAVNGNGGLISLRCISGNCTNNNSWTSTTLVNGGTGLPFAGNTPDGRAFVVYGSGTTSPLMQDAPLSVAIEQADAGYILGGLSDCARSGVRTMNDAAGYVSAQGRWRIVHTPTDLTFSPLGLKMFWQQP
jgi:hypothetical protein